MAGQMEGRQSHNQHTQYQQRIAARYIPRHWCIASNRHYPAHDCHHHAARARAGSGRTGTQGACHMRADIPLRHIKRAMHLQPAASISPADILPERQTKNQPRITARELPDLLRAIHAYDGRELTRYALQLLALTFVRTGELIGARWDEIDFTAARWDIPAERMKMKSPHIVPLSKQAIEVLRQIHDITGSSQWVVPHDILHLQ